MKYIYEWCGAMLRVLPLILVMVMSTDEARKTYPITAFVLVVFAVCFQVIITKEIVLNRK